MSIQPTMAPSQSRALRAPNQITPDQLRNYFAVRPTVQFPAWTIIFFVLALCPLCSLPSALSSSNASTSLGIGFTLLVVLAILVGIGVLGIYLTYAPQRKFNNRDNISAAEYESWINYQAGLARAKAFTRLNIDSDPETLARRVQVVSDPVALIGYVSSPLILPNAEHPWAIAAVCREMIGKTETGKKWYRKPRFLFMFPRQDLLQIYEYTVDAAYTGTIEDGTHEFFYTDVVGISSEQTRHDFPIGSTSISVSSLTITLSATSGEKISISQPREGHMTSEESENEREVKKLRELVRNMKGRPQGGYVPQGFPQGGYPAGYPQTQPGYGQPGYPPSPTGPSVPLQSTPGYPPQGYPQQPYPPQGYPQQSGQSYPQQPAYPPQQPGYPAPAGPSQPLNPAEMNQGYPVQQQGYAPPPPGYPAQPDTAYPQQPPMNPANMNQGYPAQEPVFPPPVADVSPADAPATPPATPDAPATGDIPPAPNPD
jgi:hypothetical protein